ncbi:MAG: hypothetical protein HYY51_02120 [Candidatus Magasanikbacteria bacterium]|nr:hypothetical protein [Candidatus Magasanikbacteria bacterium]
MRNAGVVVLGPPLVVRCIERPEVGKFEIQVLCESRSESGELAWILRAAEIIWIDLLLEDMRGKGFPPEDLEVYVASEEAVLPGAVLLVFSADEAVEASLLGGMLIRHSNDAETWLSRTEAGEG